jgi:hypothetical protein
MSNLVWYPVAAGILFVVLRAAQAYRATVTGLLSWIVMKVWTSFSPRARAAWHVERHRAQAVWLLQTRRDVYDEILELVYRGGQTTADPDASVALFIHHGERAGFVRWPAEAFAA